VSRDDAALVSSAAGFEALVTAHQARVRRQLRRLTRGDDALADDLAQDTFVQAWRHVGSFRGDASVATWLFRIAYNTYLAHRRRQRDEVWVETVEVDTVPGGDDTGRTMQRLDVERALALLPEAERVALTHCYGLDLSHAEAAEVLGWPLGTLKSHVARGKARLRQHLAAWQESP
jgi:RNA polymerase sigma-70 factor (ECF subfamily)